MSLLPDPSSSSTAITSNAGDQNQNEITTNLVNLTKKGQCLLARLFFASDSIKQQKPIFLTNPALSKLSKAILKDVPEFPDNVEKVNLILF